VQKSTGIMKIPISALNFSPPKSSQEGIDSISVMKKRDSLFNAGKSLVFVLNNGMLTPVEIQLGLSDGIKVEVKNAELTSQSELVLGVKGSGTAPPKSKGLIQTPTKTPRTR
jgi:hypothetical protein